MRLRAAAANSTGSIPTIAEVLAALRRHEQIWGQRLEVEEVRRDGCIARMGEKIIAALKGQAVGATEVFYLIPFASFHSTVISQSCTRLGNSGPSI